MARDSTSFLAVLRHRLGVGRAGQFTRRMWVAERHWQRRLLFWAAGAAIGLAAILLAKAADEAYALLQALLARYPYAPLLLTPGGFALLVYVTNRWFQNAQGSGIQQVIAASELENDPAARHALVAPRVALGKMALTVLGIFCGAASGREGPTVQLGASLMHTVGRLTRLPQRGLIVAGGAAGLAAAFNTPLAGLVFAIEELSRSFEQRTSGLVLTTIIIGGLVSMALMGQYSYFGTSPAVMGGVADWAMVPVCAIVGGVLGGVFSRLVIMILFKRPARLGQLIRRSPAGFAAACGLVTAIIGIALHGATFGTGYDQAKGLLEGTGTVPPLFGFAKFAATLLSTVSGIPGGIFSPSLAVGAGLGADLAHLVPMVPATTIVLLTMAAYFAGVVQAPITAAIIVMEMTEASSMVLPIMATTLLAQAVSQLVCPQPIYHALSELFLPGRATDKAP